MDRCHAFLLARSDYLGKPHIWRIGKDRKTKEKLLHSVFLQKLGDGIVFFDIKLEVMITDRFSKCQMLTNKYCRVKVYVMGIKGSRKEDDLGCGGEAVAEQVAKR